MMEDSWQLPTLRRYSAYGLERGLVCNFIFSVRIKTRTWHHKTKHEGAAKMITTQEPLDTIGGYFRKSPPKTTTLTPKGESGHYMMLRKVQSIASALCWCCAGTSSQTIGFASWSN
jgi:hypothetical protein